MEIINITFRIDNFKSAVKCVFYIWLDIKVVVVV